MKTFKKFHYSLIIMSAAIMLLYGCGNNKTGKNEPEIKADTAIAYVDKVPADAKKIDLKSAIIQMQSSAMGLTQNITIYFDDYGRRQMSEVSQKLMGQEMKMCTIKDSLYIYTYTIGEKTGKKKKVDIENNPDDINFNAITRDMARELKLKKNGTAEILGRKCDVYNMEVAKVKLKGTYYIWKGIPLMTKSTVMGMEIKLEATKIDENPVIPADKFKVPSDIKFEEANEDMEI